MSAFVLGQLGSLGMKHKLLNDMNMMHDMQDQHISDFRKAFDEQSRCETEKLLADVCNLVSSHMRRQRELVDVRLNGLMDSAFKNKVFLDARASSISQMMPNESGGNFPLRQRMILEMVCIFLQQNIVAWSVTTVEAASKQWKDMITRPVAAMDEIIRSTIESSEQHDLEVASSRNAADADLIKSNEDSLCHFGSVLEHGRESSSRMMASVEAHGLLLEELHEDRAAQASHVKQQSEKTYQERCKEYEPSGEIPVRSEPDVPSKGKGVPGDPSI